MASRYLTPTSIALLALIAMYCDDYVPSNGRMDVLDFITSQLLPHRMKRRKTAGDDVTGSAAGIEVFQRVLSPLKKDVCDFSLWSEFCYILWKISNLDYVFDFFKSLPALFDVRDKRSPEDEQTVLSSTSIWGTFVRRSVVEFERLNFQDAVRLWQNYERFRAPTSSEKRRVQINQQDLETTTYVDELDRRSNHLVSTILSRDRDGNTEGFSRASASDNERLLTFLIERLQGLGNRLPIEVRSQFEDIVYSSSNESSLSHYASFLDAWSNGDYQSSFEYLHRYYDYAMHNKDRSQYQYALLNMAILQADFGSHEEAIAAMHETIATARENKDMPCLNFSLSWLHHFRTVYRCDMKDSVNQSLLGPSAASLAFLKAKAYESNMWSVVSSTLLNEARLTLSQGVKPHVVLDKIYASSHLNVKHSIRSSQGAQMLMQASVYGRLGATSLSTSYAGLIVDGYQHELRAEDILRARCLLAQNHSLAGDHASEEKALETAKGEAHQSLQLHQLLLYHSAMIKLRRCLHHNDLNAAELLLATLDTAPESEPDFRFQIVLLRIDYLKRRKDYGAAFKLIETLAEPEDSELSSPRTTDVQHRILLLSAKAILFAKCSKPQKGLSLALRATIAGLEAKILPATWEAVATLAGVLTSIGEPEAAEQVLESCVYQATETEDSALMAYLQSTYADAAIAIAGKTRGRPHECRTAMERALSWVRRAYASHNAVEDFLGKREMAAKEAVVLRLLGDDAGADRQMALHRTLGEDQMAT